MKQQPEVITFYRWTKSEEDRDSSSQPQVENENTYDQGTRLESEDEAELPCQSECSKAQREDKHDEEEDIERGHESAPLPGFSCFQSPPQQLGVLEPLEYYPLDPEVNPIRLLVLLPHFGDSYSTVQCNLFPVSLKQHHYCYAAVIRTRGNKTLTSNIVVNCQRKQITRNLEVFLRHVRKEKHALKLWVREICVDSNDITYHQTPERRDWVFNNACSTISMPEFMEKLQEGGVLEQERQITLRQKAWSKVIRWDAPTHFPIPLRTFENVKLVTDETIDPIPHEYVPLDLVAEEIRLVVLLPAKNRSDPLYAHFAHESIYGNVAYQCLSYTWGTDETTSELTLNGMTIAIRKNLENALRGLRNETSKTTIWIDAICIDQRNVKERSRQVSRMHQIYENADGVLVWLGEADEDSDLALDFIASKSGYDAMDILRDRENGEATVPRPFEYTEGVSSEVEVEHAVFVSRDTSTPSGTTENEGGRATENDFGRLHSTQANTAARRALLWAAVYRLLQRPYFRRMWVVQEIAAASLPTVWCGTRSVSWGDLHSACLELMKDWININKTWQQFGISINPTAKGKEIHDGIKCLNSIHPLHGITMIHRFAYLRQRSLLQQPLNFLFLALLHRESDCTDPRDKIYALWNLERDARDLGMTPDYSLSVRDVYISFAKQYILHHSCLDIICAPQVRCITPLEGGLPSWVPDWRATSHTNGYIRPEVLPLSNVNEPQDLDGPVYHASRSTKAVVGFVENDEWLICGGMLVDTVSLVAAETGNGHDWYQIAVEHCHNSSGEKVSEEKFNRDFWSMILGDGSSSWEYDPQRGQVRVSQAEGDDNAHKTSQIFSDRKVITPNIKGRKFIITKNGFMGLAPSWVEVGDTLAILFGCNVPVLLSKCAEDSTHFHLKGDCFVQGWMRGETLDNFGNITDEEIVAKVLQESPGIQIR